MSHTKRIGTQGELLVSQTLMEKEFDVYSGVGDYTKIDLIAIKEKQIFRFQVKTVTDTSSGSIVASASKVTDRKKIIYQADAFDYLAICALDKKLVGFVPLSFLLEKGSTVTLRFTPTKNNQKKLTYQFNDFQNI